MGGPLKGPPVDPPHNNGEKCSPLKEEMLKGEIDTPRHNRRKECL